MTAATDHVTRNDDQGWDFTCPVFTNATCGFQSVGWPTKEIAVDRAREHFGEHKGEGVTSSLDEFRAKHGLTDKGTLPDGAVRVEDL